LVVTSALAALVTMSGAAAIAVWQIWRATDRAVETAVRTRLEATRETVSPSGQLSSLAARAGRAALWVQVLDAGGGVVSSSPSLSGDPPLLSLSAARGSAPPREVSPVGRDIDLTVGGAPLQVRGQAGALVVGVENEGFLDARTQVIVVVVTAAPLVTLLSAALAWLLTGRTLRSVVQLAEEADALSMAEPHRSLRVAAADSEMERLVAALNRMLARLDQRFSENLAASAATTHRLRTPLATLRADAELALTDPDPEAARDALTRIIEDADRLATLINHLLASAGPSRRLGGVDELRGPVAREWQRQAALKGRELHVVADGAGVVDIDALHACVDPLIENALQHGSGPTVTVTATVGATVTVQVENTGSGVPPELVDRLFDPWIGTSRSGLGLWLAREAARSGGGDLQCLAPGPPVTVFEVHLAAPTTVPAVDPTRAERP
jgi:signal transduction histidine kinase